MRYEIVVDDEDGTEFVDEPYTATLYLIQFGGATGDVLTAATGATPKQAVEALVEGWVD